MHVAALSLAIAALAANLVLAGLYLRLWQRVKRLPRVYKP